jgi:hypothetical protein
MLIGCGAGVGVGRGVPVAVSTNAGGGRVSVSVGVSRMMGISIVCEGAAPIQQPVTNKVAANHAGKVFLIIYSW